MKKPSFVADWAQGMLKLGKHLGKSFEEVASHDRSYCAWVLREKILVAGLRKFRAHLLSTHGGLLHIGKHKGKFFDEVLQQDEDYCSWVKSLSGDPGAFGAFIAYLQDQEREQEEVNAPQKKKRRVQEEEETCKICFNGPINSVLVPCGHVFACMRCAERLASTCPICKQEICYVQKTFRA